MRSSLRLGLALGGILAAPLVFGEDLVDAPGVDAVRRHCAACHSTALVAQNRASRDGWQSIIRWMQDSQNLWPLGADEEPILDYLAANYAPRFTGRRPLLAESLLPPDRGIP